MPVPKKRRTWLVGAAGLPLLVAAGAVCAHHSPSASAAAIAIDVPVVEPLRIATHEEIPPEPLVDINELADRHPMPLINGTSIEELYPQLSDWIHPITGAAELYPPEAARHFGAERVGIERPECGAGHCGVDLDGPRGRPIVAVADGTVVRVEHAELGLDGRSGRYVRIQHDDGTLTAYMHLDGIAEGLQVGDHVDGGQFIGTLGATACFTAAPHLHFSVEIPNDPTSRGDITDTHYIDPAPFLVRAKIVSVPDRRPAIHPEM